MLKPFADDQHIFQIIRIAQRAPSVFNTQPWSFWICADDRIELRPHFAGEPGGARVWPDRQLHYADAAARELTISCGAALFNLRMAIRATGHQVAVSLLPNPVDDPMLLASVEIVTGRVAPPTAEEQDLYDAIPRRHTCRQPFTGRQVPHDIMTELLTVARKEKCWLRELYPFQVADWLYAAARAEEKLRSCGDYMDELSRWTGRAEEELRSSGLDLAELPQSDHAGPGLGVPAESYGPRPAAPDPPVRDFTTPPDSRLAERFEPRPQLLSLATDYNRPLDWLRAGQALQAVLLTAAHHGVAASFLTQSLELADRRQLAEDGWLRPADRLRLPDRIQLADDRHKSRRWPNPNGSWFEETPQMIIRVGFSDRHEPQTPREHAPQVIDLRDGRQRLVPPPSHPLWIEAG
jgi:nitroreductase